MGVPLYTDEVTVIDGDVPAEPHNPWDPNDPWYPVYVLYTVPPSSDRLIELVRAKAGGTVPTIRRVRVYYRVEWKEPNAPFFWKWRLEMLDCRGEWATVYESGYRSWRSPVDEGEVDASSLFGCQMPALGVNALAVRINSPGPLGTEWYRVTVRVRFTWGW